MDAKGQVSTLGIRKFATAKMEVTLMQMQSYMIWIRNETTYCVCIRPVRNYVAIIWIVSVSADLGIGIQIAISGLISLVKCETCLLLPDCAYSQMSCKI
jgi:hypothetical protein